MINTLEDYIWRSLPDAGDFVTNSNLSHKVSHQGKLLPFYGSTVVFLLDTEVKAQLKQLQENLYNSAGWMLAEPLQEDTFHMTLHDLVNGLELTEELSEKMIHTEERAKRILAQWYNLPPLRMKATWMFNMVNTSVVLGLVPADADSWQQLAHMYEQLETIVPLGYGLTPHITMAYYRPGVYNHFELEGLQRAFLLVDMEVTLRMENLVFQTFCDMNHYQTK